MSSPQPPKPAKLVIGLLVHQKTLVTAVADALVRRFGGLDFVSRWMPFDYTGYYDDEMGTPIVRRMLSFRSLVSQGSLAKIKHRTNNLEKQWMQDGKRRVNIDPGYLLHERFVLATGKNYSHRIYIGHHMYADLTLIYRQGAFHPLPWTYPDYADTDIRHFLLNVRHKYIADIRQGFL